MFRIEYFNVYNRWGQLVFSTQTDGQGWDGNISGEQQGTGVYMWAVKAVDYNGKPYFQKGTDSVSLYNTGNNSIRVLFRENNFITLRSNYKTKSFTT